MELKIEVNKETLKSEGNESTLYCTGCKSELRAGARWVLFCPKCRISEDPKIKIDSVMSCVHCDEHLTVKLNYDGRITGRCENKKCGDCWSMQDLCLIGLRHPILPSSFKGDPSEDPYILYIEAQKKAEVITQEWVDIKTLKYVPLQQELFDYFSKKNPQLLEKTSFTTFANQALINAIDLSYQRLRCINNIKDSWYSLSRIAKEHNLKRKEVSEAVKIFIENSCPAEARHYIRQQGSARFVYHTIYRWIIRDLIKDSENEDVFS